MSQTMCKKYELPGSPPALSLDSQSPRDLDRAWGPRGSPAAAVYGFNGRPGADRNVLRFCVVATCVLSLSKCICWSLDIPSRNVLKFYP